MSERVNEDDVGNQITPDGLAALDPGTRIVGEEATAADPSLLDGIGSGRLWLIDPVDGTGNFAAGLIAAATGSEHGTGEGAAKEVVLGVYSNIGWISVAAGVGVILISPLIKRLMHLDTLKDADHAMAGETQLAEPIAPGTRTRGEMKPGELRS